MEPLTIGMTVDCVVTRLEPYGACIVSHGRDGLITIPEVSWSRISHPGDSLSIGQCLRVMVLATPEGGPFLASLRAVHPERDPWFVPGLFAVGNKFSGTVECVLKYGCFVSLRPGVSGLLIRDKWVEPLNVGDQVQVQIENVDIEARKIELSLSSS